MNDRPNRLLSVDALRGLDMLVIIGLDALIHAFARAWPVAPMTLLSEQFSHAEWIGVHAYDLIFPLFIFLSGVSLAIVDARPAAQAISRGPKLMSAARRMLVLVLLGIVYNFGWEWSWEPLRFPSVLGLIGVSSFLAAATLVLFRRGRARIAVWIAIAAVVAGLQLFYPVPGHGSGLLTPEGSVNGYVDSLILPGRLHGGTYDPEGLLGMLSAATIALAGAGAGTAMLSGGRYGAPASLCLAGFVLSAAGVAIGPFYPPIKSLWTVSFDLIAIGCCMLLLGAARLLFDQRRSSRFGALDWRCSRSDWSQCNPRIHVGTLPHLSAVCAACAAPFGMGIGWIGCAHCGPMGAASRTLCKGLHIPDLIAFEPPGSPNSDKRLANRLQSGSI